MTAEALLHIQDLTVGFNTEQGPVRVVEGVSFALALVVAVAGLVLVFWRWWTAGRDDPDLDRPGRAGVLRGGAFVRGKDEVVGAGEADGSGDGAATGGAASKAPMSTRAVPSPSP